MKKIFALFLCLVCLLPFFTIGAGVSADSNITVRVGVYENKPSYFTDENGQQAGFWIDILTYIAAREDWTIQYVHGTRDECLQRLKTHEIDLMPDYAFTEDRAKIYDFSKEPVYYGWSKVYSRAGLTISAPSDLEGKTVAVLKDAINFVGPDSIQELTSSFSINCTFIKTDSYLAVFTLLDKGEADAGVVTKDFGNVYAGDYNVMPSDIIFQPVRRFFVFPHEGNFAFIAVIDNDIRELKADGKSIYYTSSSKWLGAKLVEKPILSNQNIFFLFGLLALAVLLGAGVVLFNYQVRRKTRQLVEEIQEHKADKVEISNLNLRLEALLSAIPDIITEVDIKKKYTWVNEAGYLFFGKDVIGKAASWFFEGEQDVYSKVDSIFQGDKNIIYLESWQRRCDGEKRLLGWWCRTLLGDDGSVRGALSTARDITENKKTEKALIESKEKLEAIFQSMTDAVFITDTKAQFAEINDAFATYHRFKNKAECQEKLEHFGDYIEVYFPDGTLTPWDMLAAPRALQGETGNGSEYKIRRKDTGETWWGSYSFNPIRDKEQNIVGAVVVAHDITKRKQADEAIIKAKSKLEAVFESMTDAVLITDAQGKLLEINEAFATYHRCSNKAECYSKVNNYTDYLALLYADGSEVPPNMQPVTRAMQGETANGSEYQIRRKDTGEVWWGSYSFNPIRDKENNIVGAVVVAHDITNRKKADEAIIETKRKLEAVFQSMTDAVFISDTNGQFVEYNDAFIMLNRYSSRTDCPAVLDKFIEQREFYTADGSILPKNMRPAYRALRGETVVNTEFKVSRKDTGESWWSSYSANPVRDKDDHIIGAVVVSRDITNRKKADQDLKESQEKFFRAFNFSPVGMALLDSETKAFVEVNERWAEILEYQSSEMLGRTTAELNMYPDLTARDRLWQILNETKRVQNQEVIYRTKTGKIILALLSAEIVPLKGRNYLISTIIDITERRKMEKALLESGEKLNKIFETVPEGIALIDLNGIIIDANPAEFRMHGYSNKDDIIGQNLIELIAEKEHINASGVVETLKTKGIITNIPLRCKRKDGSEFSGEISTVLMKDAQDKPIGFVSVTSDITERKEKENALRENESKLKEAQEMAHLGFWSWDINTGMVEWSEEVFKIFHLDPEVFKPQIDTILDLSPWPGDHERDQELILRAVATHQPGSYEQKFLRPDKSIGYYYSTFQGKYNEKDELVSIVGTVLDITERKVREQALVESEEKIRRIFDSVPDGIIVADIKGVIINVNLAILSMQGYSGKEEITGKNILDLMTAEDRKVVRTHYNELLEKEIVRNRERTFVKKDGTTFPVEVSTSVLKDNDGKNIGLIVIVSDMTERKKSVEEHRKMVEYQELDRVKTNLLSTISHELRTPLASIKGYASLLLMYDRKLKKEQKFESLEAIDRSTDRLTELIEHLLDMSRLDAGLLKLTLAPMNPLEIVIAAVSEAKLRSPNYNFKNDAAVKIPEIMADSKRLRQIIDNILENAVKYSPPDTLITLKTAVKHEELQISITDQGRGIAVEEYEKIFERMYRIEQRLQKDPGGLGLGLSLCKALVEGHGGRIWVESVVGKGSTFYFTIPLTHEVKETQHAEKKKARV